MIETKNYNRAISLARHVIWKSRNTNNLDKVTDLVHDTYLYLLDKKSIDLFEQNSVFIWRSLNYRFMNEHYRSKEYRNNIRFEGSDYIDIIQGADDDFTVPTKHVNKFADFNTPYEILVGKELRKNFSSHLNLKLEGYLNREIADIDNINKRTVGQRLERETKWLGHVLLGEPYESKPKKKRGRPRKNNGQ